MIRHFIETLFSTKAPEHYIMVWRARDHATKHFRELDRAAAYLADNHEGDMYVGVGLTGEDRESPRGAEEDVVAVVGFVADVDYQSPVMKKGKTYAPKDKALDLLRQMPFIPTIIVHSGHGFQGWWLFKEPYVIEDEAERVYVKNLSRAWNCVIRDRARREGNWDIDATFDLVRLMRCPGTTNCKEPKHKVPVTIVSENVNARLADPSDVEQFLPDGWEENKGNSAAAPAITLNPNAQPPFEKYDVLRNNDPKFRATCDRQRRDMRDSSASGFDMSLACTTVMAGWTDQEIADLLVAMRRKAGDELKIDRSDYYIRTIENARKFCAQTTALDALATTEAGDKDARRKVCDALGGLPIQRIIRYIGADGGVYYILANGQHVPIGGIDALMNQRLFLNRVADVTGIVKPPIKTEHWWSLAQLIRDMAEDDEFASEESETALLSSRLEEYLDNYPPTLNVISQVEAKHPFLRDGAVHVYLDKVATYLEMIAREKRTPLKLRVAMRALGAEPVTVGATIYGRATTRSYWKLPPEVGGRFVEMLSQKEED